MYNLLLYKTFILRSLVIMLEDEGIVVTTTAALDIEKILANTDVEKLKSLLELKYHIAPLLCRNKEDQDKVYKIFEKLDAIAAIEYKEHKEEPGEQINSNKEIKNNWEKFKSSWYLKKIIIPAATVLALLLLGYFLFYRIPSLHSSLPSKISIAANHDQVVVNDTVVFTAAIDSTLDKKNISVDWRLADTVFQNSFSVTRIITDTSLISVTAILKKRHGAAIDSAEYSLKALCELPPSVDIDESDVAYNSLKQGNSSKKRFEPLFTNADENKKAYTYRWYVDSTLYSTDSVLNYSKPYSIIKLVVDTKNTHCSADSLVAQIESLPALKASIKGDGSLKFSSTYKWKNIWMSCLLLLILPGIISFLIYRIILSVKTYIPEIKKTEPGAEGPFEIKFQDQQHNINTENGIRKLADVLRKRQVSNMYKLNLRKTIRSTVIAGGIPNLEFTPLTKPVSYLVFIDKEKPESLLVKLFEYLAEKLEKDEVNIFVYEYFKEPLFLSNEKLNQERIPLQKIAALYPDTTLFIFGDAQYFLFPLKGTVKNWVTHKLNNWQTKILITPYTVDDWDKKEKLLIDSNFFVLPADLSSIALIDKIISGQIDTPGQKKEHLENGYRARFLNFQDFETLKTYAGEGPLFQWICSLAVYPSTDWDFTIAVGKAIEDQINKSGIQTELVNYTNLLKIARISWMQDDVINEGLRAKMLEYLDKDAEELARETLNQQLHLIEDTIDDNSLVKARFDIHKKLNKFLLDSYQHKQISKEDGAFVKRSLEKNRLDEGQDIYLNRGTNSLLIHPFKKEEDVGISRYFKLETYRHILNSAGYALMIMFALMLISFNLVKSNSGYLNWSSVKPVEQTYILNVYSNNPGREVTMDLYYDPTHTKKREEKFSLSNKSDVSFKYDDIAINDTTGYGLLQISTNEGQLITQDSFKLNSVIYTININEVAKIPLKIYYKDASSLTLANTLADNLPVDFNITTQQFGLNDTASAAVYYFSKEHEEDASLAAMVTGAILEKNITPRLTDSAAFKTANADVVVYINQSVTCTPLAITALPQSLNEIWHGGTSNRLININLSKRVIYYSVNNTSTFGTYSINEVCLTKKGTYKIITKSNQGYKLFFIRNANRQSFELSVCQNFVPSKTELENKDESYCDKFNIMRFYYASDPTKIFLSVSGGTLAVTEKRKLDKLLDSSNRISKTSKYGITLYSSTKYLPQFEKSAIGKILSNSSVIYGQSKASLPIVTNLAIPSSNPFQRNYLVFNISKTDPMEKEQNPTSKQPEKNQPAQSIPDCSITYTSLEQVKKLNNPLIVCKLDLSKAGLTLIPRELYTFKNMEQLNLGTTAISQSEIDQLQKTLPSCKINYSSSPNAQPAVQQIDLGNINFEKGRMTSGSISLLDRIGKALSGNKNASILLEAEYADGVSQKLLMSNVNQVISYYRKMGLSEKSGQIKQKMTDKNIQQKQQKKKSSSPDEIVIHITGINFPADFNSSIK